MSLTRVSSCRMRGSARGEPIGHARARSDANQNDTPARRSGGLLRNAEKKIMIEPFIISFKAANKTRNKQTTNKTQQGHMVTAA